MIHTYLSTSCFHDQHNHCNATWSAGTDGAKFEKTPGQCKFCDAPCVCNCHHNPSPGLMDPPSHDEWEMIRANRRKQNE